MSHQAIGCLLIHGFTSSPTEMAGLAAFLSARNYKISVPLLPGHATDPKELLQVSHRDWIATVESALRELQQETEEQVVIGLSMGGALALHLAANFKFKAVVAMAPALKLPWWMKTTVYAMMPFVRTRRKTHGPDVRDEEGRALLDSYLAYPLSATLNLFRLQRMIRNELPRITMPILVIHSRQDHTIPLRVVNYLARRVQSKQVEKMIVNESYHVLTVDRDHPAIFERIAEFIAAVTE